MTENIAKLAGAYSKTPPNELEKRLQEQSKPGYVPYGSLGAWAIAAALRGLKVTDPQKYERIKAAQVNGADADAIQAILRGEAQ